MGCWNGTCALSNLSINHGQKVKLILLIKNPYSCQGDMGGGYCYSTALWNPLFFPISGVYNDYGSLEKIVENDNTKAFHSYILNSEDVKVNIPDHKENNLKTFESVIDTIERGYVSVKVNGQLSQIAFVLILEEIYNEVIKMVKSYKNKYWGTYYEILEKRLKGFEAEFKICGIGCYYSEETFVSPTMKEHGLYKIMKPEEKKFFQLYKALHEFNDRVHMPIEYVIEGIEDKVSMIPLMEELYCISGFMSTARKLWTPSCGAGSQNDNLDDMKVFYTKCINYIEKEKKKWELENGE